MKFSTLGWITNKSNKKLQGFRVKASHESDSKVICSSDI